MKSYFGISHEVLDMRLAAEELLSCIPAAGLCENTLGILFCDSELEDYPTLLTTLGEGLAIPYIGCTSVAMLNQEEGISEISICLLVLTADDCRFSTALSAPIQKNNAQDSIAAVYKDAAKNLRDEARMVLAYSPLNLDVMIDLYPEILAEVSGNLPIFGGVAGHNAPFGAAATIYDGAVYRDRLVIALVEGNVQPLFSSGVKLSHVAEGHRSITQAQENTIYSVDGMPVPEYLSSMGLDPQKLAEDDTDILFLANPFMLTNEEKDEEEYRLIRTLQTLDLETGTGHFLARMPQGHNIAIGTLSRQDIAESAEEGIQGLLQQIEAAETANPAYRYSAILATSCMGRYMVMAPNTELEGNVVIRQVPPHLHFHGYYSYGEFAPTLHSGGNTINTAQNESLTLCAL